MFWSLWEYIRISEDVYLSVTPMVSLSQSLPVLCWTWRCLPVFCWVIIDKKTFTWVFHLPRTLTSPMLATQTFTWVVSVSLSWKPGSELSQRHWTDIYNNNVSLAFLYSLYLLFHSFLTLCFVPPLLLLFLNKFNLFLNKTIKFINGFCVWFGRGRVGVVTV